MKKTKPSDEESIAEISSDGSWVTSHALPQDVTDLSGLAIDCASSEAWVSSSSGTVTHLSGLQCGITSGVDNEIPDLEGFTLESNFPNPFNPNTTLRYSLSSALPVRLTIYDSRGFLVRVLVDENQTSGTHRAVWNGRNSTGELVASGVYFYRLSAGTREETRRMVFVK